MPPAPPVRCACTACSRPSQRKVYRAFLDADAVAKWLPPHGFTAHVEHMDPKVGGTLRMSFKNFTTGNTHSFGGEYLELKPHELIRYTDRFDDPNLPGVMHVTIKLKAVSQRAKQRAFSKPYFCEPAAEQVIVYGGG